MGFEEMVMEEFLEYKYGFINGKNSYLNLVRYGVTFMESVDTNNWYGMGYEDGYVFYSECGALDSSIPDSFIVGEDVEIIIKDNFADRIIDYNMRNNTCVPMVRYKMMYSGR